MLSTKHTAMKRRFIVHLFLLFNFTQYSSYCKAQNNCLAFNGDDSISTTYSGITGGSSRTFEFWLYVNSSTDDNMGGTPMTVGGWGKTGNGTNHFFVRLGSLNRIYLDVNGITIRSEKNMVDFNWHHVAFVYDSGVAKPFLLYIDGKLDTTMAGVTLNTGNGRNFKLGSNEYNDNFLYGKLDEVRVFNYARSESMIKADMNREYCSAQTGLQLYYKMNDGEVESDNRQLSFVKDHSGNQRHGNIISFTRLYSLSNFISGISLSGGSSRDTFTVFDCKSITSTSGKYVWTKTGNYRDTIANFYGCDSLLLVRVKIGNSTDTLSINACDSFISPLNNIYKFSGIYKETYTAFTGCDSVLYYKVFISPNKIRKLKISSCDSFISPSGKKYENSGLYTEHFQTYYGCDSAIEYDVKILEQSISFEIINACDSVFVRGKWHKQNATPLFVFKNINGCDSTHTIVVRMHYSNSISVKIIACDSFITPNQSIIRKDSVHTETYRTVHGCDSVVTYKIKIQKTVQRSLNMKACRRAIINGQTYSNSGMVNLKLKTYLGCDSLVEIDLNLVKINRGIERKHGILTSMQPNAKYTWINCINKQAIPFQTDSTFKVKLDDYYAVVIEYDACKDTSICYHFLATSIDDNKTEDLGIYPNPNNGDFNIKFNEAESGTLYINDLSGRLISMQNFDSSNEWHVQQELSKGVYLLTIINGNKVTRQKLIIN